MSGLVFALTIVTGLLLVMGLAIFARNRAEHDGDEARRHDEPGM